MSKWHSGLVLGSTPGRCNCVPSSKFFLFWFTMAVDNFSCTFVGVSMEGYVRYTVDVEEGGLRSAPDVAAKTFHQTFCHIYTAKHSNSMYGSCESHDAITPKENWNHNFKNRMGHASSTAVSETISDGNSLTPRQHGHTVRWR